MGIALPDISEVEAAVGHWRAKDPRFAALIARYDDMAQALRHYGLVLWDQGQPAAAAQIFTGAAALAPHDAAIWSDLSGALNASNQAREACACMEESLLRDKTNADAWLRLGTIRNALGATEGAELALKTALALDASLTDARLSLGLLYFGAKRFAEAAHALRHVLDTATVSYPAVQAIYGQALGNDGDHDGAVAALARAVELDPGNDAIAVKFAQARFMADLVAGVSTQDACAACRARPAVTDAAFEKISRQVFHLLNAFGHTDAALRLGEARLNEAPGDPERAYLLSIIKGDSIERAPESYITQHFDQFADQFDAQLVGVLGYSAFAQLATLVAEHADALPRIVDLGCGTGLAGPLLSGPGRHLTGVDLSGGMLEKARERGCYNALIRGEVVAYLADKPEAFDLVFAADVLIYIGDLTDFLTLAARALARGGLLAVTIEANIGADVALMPSGRFAHARDHVLALAREAGLTMLDAKSIPLRYETKAFVTGDLIVFQRS